MWDHSVRLSCCLFIFLGISVAAGSSNRFSRWIAPFNDSAKIYALCTNEMDRIVLQSPRQVIVRFYMEKQIICYIDYQFYVKDPKFRPLVWLMKGLHFCEVNQIVRFGPQHRYHREFQAGFLKYAYAVLCDRAHMLAEADALNMHVYGEIFALLYERENRQRQYICDEITSTYADVYAKCYVPAVEKRQAQIRARCSGTSIPFVKFPAFFQRFSRGCNTLEDFVTQSPNAVSNLGLALANDTAFLNLLNVNLVSNINQDSELPSLVLKTRLLLQHFAMATVKLWQQLEELTSCRIEVEAALLDGGLEDDPDGNLLESTVQQKCCIYSNNYICELGNLGKFGELAMQAWRAFYIEVVLLVVVVVNTVLVVILLIKTKKHLSTATVLFIFNIVFSNVLFLVSFGFLFSDFLERQPYGPVNEDHNEKTPELIIAETLGTHLFADHEYSKHLVQETLYSLAQNGSLTGLIHLLVLVLVVINRSMSGKSIHLSRVSVVSVFGLVWLVLIVTHVVFSTLQHSAIRNLDQLYVALARGRNYLQCNASTEIRSDYAEIGRHCDRTAVFHKFGTYLLRGHTLFTVTFVLISIVTFTITLCYHWKVRRDHDFLHSGLREQSPYRRREMLFHTLLLSIGAFFVSVIGQTYIELAVFWIDDRDQLASLTKWYQLARLAAFIDPVLNPLIVVIRTPALRRQLRAEWTSMRRSSERSRDSFRKPRSQSSEESSGRLNPVRIRGSTRRYNYSAVTLTRKVDGPPETEACLQRQHRKAKGRTIRNRRSLDSQNPSVV